MAAMLPDIVTEGLSVLFCGINPGLKAAETGHHFAGRSNRFWRVIHLAGFTPDEIAPENDRSMLQYGCGLTSVIERATASAAELAPAEFVAAADAFKRKIVRFSPQIVAFLGKSAYAGLTGSRTIAWGRQSVPIAGSIAWILPNPSGRNLAFPLARLVAAYQELNAAAALVTSAAQSQA
jgi:TDG/mug DNA glycosylase family protein